MVKLSWIFLVLLFLSIECDAGNRTEDEANIFGGPEPAPVTKPPCENPQQVRVRGGRCMKPAGRKYWFHATWFLTIKPLNKAACKVKKPHCDIGYKLANYRRLNKSFKPMKQTFWRNETMIRASEFNARRLVCCEDVFQKYLWQSLKVAGKTLQRNHAMRLILLLIFSALLISVELAVNNGAGNQLQAETTTAILPPAQARIFQMKVQPRQSCPSGERMTRAGKCRTIVTWTFFSEHNCQKLFAIKPEL